MEFPHYTPQLRGKGGGGVASCSRPAHHPTSLHGLTFFSSCTLSANSTVARFSPPIHRLALVNCSGQSGLMPKIREISCEYLHSQSIGAKNMI